MYRRTAEMFLLDKDKNILVNDSDGFIKFPGGGVDDEETPQQALERELLEEARMTAKDITHRGNVRFDFWPEWATTPKQIERAKIFRGEDSNIYSGTLDSTLDGIPEESFRFMNGKDVLARMREGVHPSEKKYVAHQRAALKLLLGLE